MWQYRRNAGTSSRCASRRDCCKRIGAVWPAAAGGNCQRCHRQPLRFTANGGLERLPWAGNCRGGPRSSAPILRRTATPACAITRRWAWPTPAPVFASSGFPEPQTLACGGQAGARELNRLGLDAPCRGLWRGAPGIAYSGKRNGGPRGWLRRAPATTGSGPTPRCLNLGVCEACPFQTCWGKKAAAAPPAPQPV